MYDGCVTPLDVRRHLHITKACIDTFQTGQAKGAGDWALPVWELPKDVCWPIMPCLAGRGVCGESLGLGAITDSKGKASLCGRLKGVLAQLH
jgi:hypothetical protein